MIIDRSASMRAGALEGPMRVCVRGLLSRLLACRLPVQFSEHLPCDRFGLSRLGDAALPAVTDAPAMKTPAILPPGWDLAIGCIWNLVRRSCVVNHHIS